MISATVLAIFLVPVFFVVVRRLFGGRRATPSPSSPSSSDREGGA
jgi:multidrug efflux pump